MIKNDTQLTNNHTELEKLSNAKKFESINFSDNVKVIISKLKSELGLFLEGHTSCINTITVTSDNKYIISGSSDKTIRIWNLLERTQEAVLEGHFSYVNSVVLTKDNKYIISGSEDKTIKLWNFFEKQKKLVLKAIITT